jgi:hypothetical protein
MTRSTFVYVPFVTKRFGRSWRVTAHQMIVLSLRAGVIVAAHYNAFGVEHRRARQ